ncbi:MAG TPA: glycosyltransferase [Planctomycetota bacterium]|nr:glycosyltransferase [Planctomycetota bacterium]
MNRILYVITELDVGGAEKALVALATRLNRAAYEPQVACLSGRGPLGADLRERGIPVHFLGARGWWDVRALWRLRRLARQADIVHSFLYHANMAARLAAVGTRVAAVVSSARVAERSRPGRRRLECLTHRLVDAEVCVSNGVRDFFAAGGFPTRKLVVIPNGVDAARFAGRDPAFKARLGIRPDAPLVTTIGRLHEQKGMGAFVRAAASVRHSRPDCHFLIVGAGPLEAALRAAAKGLHLEGGLTFLGHCDDVPAVLRATDVFVLASLWEGMPNVVLEAMAAGLPVVATRVEGTVDLIEHNETGLLVMPRDVPGLVSAIQRVLDEPALAQRLGAAARERVRTHFPLDAMVRRHEALYADLLARR